jgi:hypothetical protein
MAVMAAFRGGGAERVAVVVDVQPLASVAVAV